MGKKKSTSSGVKRKMKPAATPEARENQLISMAYDVVEQRLLDGSASAQETVHFLKLGSTKARAELEKLKKENALISAKTEALDSAKRVEELYANALKAMQTYSGVKDVEDE